MSRLTKNNELGGYYSDYYGPEKQPEIQKLGKLEDIEDELGIDLVTLFKALRDGAWFKIGNRFYTDRPNLIRDARQFTLQVPYHGFVNVKDYGKTWALTKEELE